MMIRDLRKEYIVSRESTRSTSEEPSRAGEWEGLEYVRNRIAHLSEAGEKDGGGGRGEKKYSSISDERSLGGATADEATGVPELPYGKETPPVEQQHSGNQEDPNLKSNEKQVESSTASTLTPFGPKRKEFAAGPIASEASVGGESVGWGDTGSSKRSLRQEAFVVSSDEDIVMQLLLDLFQPLSVSKISNILSLLIESSDLAASVCWNLELESQTAGLASSSQHHHPSKSQAQGTAALRDQQVSAITPIAVVAQIEDIIRRVHRHPDIQHLALLLLTHFTIHVCEIELKAYEDSILLGSEEALPGGSVAHGGELFLSSSLAQSVDSIPEDVEAAAASSAASSSSYFHHQQHAQLLHPIERSIVCRKTLSILKNVVLGQMAHPCILTAAAACLREIELAFPCILLPLLEELSTAVVEGIEGAPPASTAFEDTRSSAVVVSSSTRDSSLASHRLRRTNSAANANTGPSSRRTGAENYCSPGAVENDPFVWGDFSIRSPSAHDAHVTAEVALLCTTIASQTLFVSGNEQLTRSKNNDHEASSSSSYYSPQKDWPVEGMSKSSKSPKHRRAGVVVGSSGGGGMNKPKGMPSMQVPPFHIAVYKPILWDTVGHRRSVDADIVKIKPSRTTLMVGRNLIEQQQSTLGRPRPPETSVPFSSTPTRKTTTETQSQRAVGTSATTASSTTGPSLSASEYATALYRAELSRYLNICEGWIVKMCGLLPDLKGSSLFSFCEMFYYLTLLQNYSQLGPKLEAARGGSSIAAWTLSLLHSYDSEYNEADDEAGSSIGRTPLYSAHPLLLHMFMLFMRALALGLVPPAFLISMEDVQKYTLSTDSYTYTSGRYGLGFYLLDTDASWGSFSQRAVSAVQTIANHPVSFRLRSTIISIAATTQAQRHHFLPPSYMPWEAPALMHRRLIIAARSTQPECRQKVMSVIRSLRDRCWTIPSVRTMLVASIAQLVVFNPHYSEVCASLLASCSAAVVESILSSIISLETRTLLKAVPHVATHSSRGGGMYSKGITPARNPSIQSSTARGSPSGSNAFASSPPPADTASASTVNAARQDDASSLSTLNSLPPHSQILSIVATHVVTAHPPRSVVKFFPVLVRAVGDAHVANRMALLDHLCVRVHELPNTWHVGNLLLHLVRSAIVAETQALRLNGRNTGSTEGSGGGDSHQPQKTFSSSNEDAAATISSTMMMMSQNKDLTTTTSNRMTPKPLEQQQQQQQQGSFPTSSMEIFPFKQSIERMLNSILRHFSHPGLAQHAKLILSTLSILPLEVLASVMEITPSDAEDVCQYCARKEGLGIATLPVPRLEVRLLPVPLMFVLPKTFISESDSSISPEQASVFSDFQTIRLTFVVTIQLSNKTNSSSNPFPGESNIETKFQKSEVLVGGGGTKNLSAMGTPLPATRDSLPISPASNVNASPNCADNYPYLSPRALERNKHSQVSSIMEKNSHNNQTRTTNQQQSIDPSQAPHGSKHSSDKKTCYGVLVRLYNNISVRDSTTQVASVFVPILDEEKCPSFHFDAEITVRSCEPFQLFASYFPSVAPPVHLDYPIEVPFDRFISVRRPSETISLESPKAEEEKKNRSPENTPICEDASLVNNLFGKELTRVFGSSKTASSSSVAMEIFHTGASGGTLPRFFSSHRIVTMKQFKVIQYVFPMREMNAVGVSALSVSSCSQHKIVGNAGEAPSGNHRLSLQSNNSQVEASQAGGSNTGMLYCDFIVSPGILIRIVSEIERQPSWDDSRCPGESGNEWEDETHQEDADSSSEESVLIHFLSTDLTALSLFDEAIVKPLIVRSGA